LVASIAYGGIAIASRPLTMNDPSAGVILIGVAQILLSLTGPVFEKIINDT
jgi:hypothetical protein